MMDAQGTFVRKSLGVSRVENSRALGSHSLSKDPSTAEGLARRLVRNLTEASLLPDQS